MERRPDGTVGEIFGVRLHHLPSGGALRRVCEGFLDGDRAFRIFPANPEILLHARADASYAEVLNRADLALPDGAGVALIQSLRSRRRVRRWPGVDVAGTVLRLASERGDTVMFLGGAAGVAARAAERWRTRLPGLRVAIAGAASAIGPDGRVRPVDRDGELVDEIRAVGPAIVLVAFGAPKQERWIALHAPHLPSARILMAVGGTFDIWSGNLPRAPRFLRRSGLEWAWRLALEPRRLPRILRATVVFPFRALTDRPA